MYQLEVQEFIDELIKRLAKTILESRFKRKNMQVVYEVNLKVVVSHEIDTIENLKDNNEFAEDLRQMICDESAFSGGVAIVDILNSKIDVKEIDSEVDETVNNDFEKTVYNDFMKNCKH